MKKIRKHLCKNESCREKIKKGDRLIFMGNDEVEVLGVMENGYIKSIRGPFHYASWTADTIVKIIKK